MSREMAVQQLTSPIVFRDFEIGPLFTPKRLARMRFHPSRSCGSRPLQGGLYFARLPRVPKLDLRLEGGYTNPFAFCGICIYTNAQYNSGYTNDGRLIGTWIGRAAQGELIRANYWLSPRKKIGVELRHRTLDPGYLRQGGSQNDVAVNADILTSGGFRVTANVQYERWQIPLLATGRQSDFATSVQFSFWPTPQRH